MILFVSSQCYWRHLFSLQLFVSLSQCSYIYLYVKCSDDTVSLLLIGFYHSIIIDAPGVDDWNRTHCQIQNSASQENEQ